MKLLVLLLFLAPGYVVFPQQRNVQMRELNRIVELMNAFSRCNQDWYFDAIQLQKALHVSSDKIHENYFYCSKTQHNGLIYYTGIEAAFHFREITPNAQNQIPVYQSDYIPWLEKREAVLKILARPGSPYHAFSSELQKYLASTDSLFTVHSQLNTYVSGKNFRSDDQFREAKKILRAHDHWFRECYTDSKRMDSVLVAYSNTHYPPLRTHLELQQGLQELNLTMNLLTDWEQELYRENLSKNADYDTQLRTLNANGLKNDSLHLHGTRGYGYLSSGFWLHTRYRQFYTSMQSRIYWLASSRFSTEGFLKQSQVAYNEFVRSYNSIMEYYNEYIAIADGLTFRETSSCCLAPSEIDTNQNVLLMAPKLLYKFEYQEQIDHPATPDSNPAHLSDEELLIRQAAPHHLIYLLDASSSMNESGKLNQLKENATNLVAMQREADRISIVTFSGKAEILLHSIPCSQKKQIGDKINRIHAFGQTNIQRGIETVHELLVSATLENGVNAVLLITDGEFPINEETRNLLNAFRTNGNPVYFIYLGAPLTKKQARTFRKLYSDMGVILYDTNSIDLKEALLKIATT